METPWCENIKIVQDSMAFWPSDGFTALIVFGVSGIIISYAALRFWAPDMGLWFGPFMVFMSVWYFQEINTERQTAIETFQSDRKIEFIGEISEQKIEFFRVREYDVEAPWGYFNNPARARFNILFKVDAMKIKANVTRFSFQPGNKCNWWRCDLEAGDRVKVSVDTESHGLLPDRTKKTKPYVETYYINPLRIERCDDR